MTAEQIRELVKGTSAELVETHISWVLLRPDDVYKIKKPVRFGFLDFSTPELRRHFCAEEVRLNRRLAPGIYLGVVPVGIRGGNTGLGVEPALDYAVHMRRLDNALEMDRLLRQGEVRPAQMERLAGILVQFHRKEILKNPALSEPGSAWADFADLANHTALLEKRLGARAARALRQWMPALEMQLHHHDPRLQQRAREGFWVEGHGDLHSRNIFLTDPPIAFDCIEFSEHLRRMDVLNELAFLCMDLEFYRQPTLAEVFLREYRRNWEVMPLPEDRLLFLFFKAYRANVRLKIGLLEMEQHVSPALESNVQQYWALFGQYIERLLNSDF